MRGVRVRPHSVGVPVVTVDPADGWLPDADPVEPYDDAPPPFDDIDEGVVDDA